MILQVALVGVWAGRGIPTTRLTVACIVLTIAGFLVLAAMSYLEHMRALRPSTILSVYLSLTILVDMARVRTLFLLPYGGSIAGIFLASFFVKVLVFAFETCEKRAFLRPDWKETATEDLSGFYNRALFFWLNSVFRRGFRTLLTVASLTPLDEELVTASNPTDLIERWENGTCRRHPGCVPSALTRGFSR